MPRFEIGKASVAAATGAAYATLHTGANVAAEILEVGFFCNAATASSVELAQPANTPVATTSTLGNASNIGWNPTSTVNFDTAWSTAPTTPTIIYKMITLPATIGAGVIWTWPPGQFVLPVSKWLVLWNFGGGTGSILNCYFVWTE